MTCRTPIGLQPFSRQLAKMFLLQFSRGCDHISLTLDPVAIRAAIAAVESMDHEKPNQTMQPTDRAGRINKLSVTPTFPAGQRALASGGSPCFVRRTSRSTVETVRPNTKIMTLDEERNQWKTWDVFPGRYSDASPDSEQRGTEILVAALSKKGAAYWNDWRAAPPLRDSRTWPESMFEPVAKTIRGPVGVNLSGYDLSGAIMNLCSLAFANLNETKLQEAKLRESLINQSTIFKSDFSAARI